MELEEAKLELELDDDESVAFPEKTPSGKTGKTAMAGIEGVVIGVRERWWLVVGGWWLAGGGDGRGATRP